MTKDELNRDYFLWMCQLVDDKIYRWERYKYLLNHLHNIDFQYDIPMDGNRAQDGMDLRYHYGAQNGVDQHIIACYLDDKPCTVLEMMVALSLRCDTDIMAEPGRDICAGKWFWPMIRNLGLIGMTNTRFDMDTVDLVVDKMMRHTYDRNGRGGLFTVEGCPVDMRDVEIWYQMNWYLNDILRNSKGEL